MVNSAINIPPPGIAQGCCVAFIENARRRPAA
jgi:hypothetical protein